MYRTKASVTACYWHTVGMWWPTSSSESFKCKKGIKSAVWIALSNNVNIYALLGMKIPLGAGMFCT